MRVHNLGVPGDTSTDIARRWQAEAAAHLHNASDGRFIFSFGANDAAQTLPPSETLANAAAILSAASARAPTLMIGPAPIADDITANQRIARLCLALASLCRTLALPYLPIHAALAATPAWMEEARHGDGAHPGAGGYAALAALVEAWPPWRRWF